MSESEVVQLRLKRSLLKQFRELTKGQSFKVAEAMRAAILLGLELVKKDKALVGMAESGMQSGEAMLKRVFENWRIDAEMKGQSSEGGSSEDDFARLPDNEMMGPRLEDLVSGKDEWYYIRKLHQRLALIEAGLVSIPVREGLRKSSGIPGDYRKAALSISKARGISPDEAYRNIVDSVEALVQQKGIKSEDGLSMIIPLQADSNAPAVIDTTIPKAHWGPVNQLAKTKGISEKKAFILLMQTALKLSGNAPAKNAGAVDEEDDAIPEPQLYDYLGSTHDYGKQQGVTMEEAFQLILAEAMKATGAAPTARRKLSSASKPAPKPPKPKP
jgi:hypothetical protein